MWTKHINIQYLFINDRALICDINIDQSPMEKIIYNIFTNTLQYHKFQQFHPKFMNVPEGATKYRLGMVCESLNGYYTNRFYSTLLSRHKVTNKPTNKPEYFIQSL